jgi:hypothetical protein
MTRVASLLIEGDRDRWRSLGLTVTEDGVVPLYGTCLRIIESAAELAPASGSPGGIVGWELSGVPADVPTSVDGLNTLVVAATDPLFGDHEMGAVGLDHVVVLTGDLGRTSDAIMGATGCELKRVREVGTMRQGFHRIGGGGLIVEIVERPEVEADEARFWGLVLNVEDLDAACRLLGEDRIGTPKDAVQPGRRIATIREDVGLGLPVALMTP